MKKSRPRMNGFLKLFLYCFFLFERLDTEYKVHDMAYPHHADDDTGYTAHRRSLQMPPSRCSPSL